MKKKIKQTAGRDQLRDFAPLFAHYNDDILFGEQWNDESVDTKTKCIVTLTSLISTGIIDESLKFHLLNAKKNGVTKEEIASIIAHIGFYAGWPKAWGAFRFAKEIWTEPALSEKDKFQNEILFPIGEPNVKFAPFFIGQSYLAPISAKAGLFHVTFEPGCRNNWHIHHALNGGGQLLICTGGKGYYQEWGKEPIEMVPGTVVEIPANVKHWHGACKDQWFSHIALEIPGENASNEWLEPVGEEYYQKLEEKQ